MTSRQAPTSTSSGGPAARDAGAGRLSWRKVNINQSERVGRIVLGLAAVTVGALLLLGATSALAVVLEVLLVLAGLDLLVTGATGHCPLYQELGHVPRSLRGSR